MSSPRTPAGGKRAPCDGQGFSATLRSRTGSHSCPPPGTCRKTRRPVCAESVALGDPFESSQPLENSLVSFSTGFSLFSVFRDSFSFIKKKIYINHLTSFQSQNYRKHIPRLCSAPGLKGHPLRSRRFSVSASSRQPHADARASPPARARRRAARRHVLARPSATSRALLVGLRRRAGPPCARACTCAVPTAPWRRAFGASGSFTNTDDAVGSP